LRARIPDEGKNLWHWLIGPAVRVTSEKKGGGCSNQKKGIARVEPLNWERSRGKIRKGNQQGGGGNGLVVSSGWTKQNH